ncbi:hypothetical protein BJY17_003259 [Agromyces hippuratus]|uniref:Uncharacterized protein n=1 Tax=Agromyces hippuratus TaxID=286438 RepID=A0A852WVZ4_9MICO|nr:hypothetical protein [Agromyces hippuratus]NYG22512.1 hypothetical protein [Agromyces hippuratus]
MSDLTPLTFDDLVRFASRIQVGAPTTGDREPERGELWRLNWDGVTELGVVVDVEEGVPITVPATLTRSRLSESQPSTARVGDRLLHFDAFTDATHPIPAIAFDRLVSSEVDWSTATVDEATTSHRDGDASLRRLASWNQSFSVGSGGLGARLKSAGFTPSLLRRELDLSLDESLALLRDHRALSDDDTTRISRLLDTTSSEVEALAGAVPASLRAALSRRRFRERVMALAVRRKELASRAWGFALFGVLETPYRQTGVGGMEDWQERADRFFEVAL